MRPIDPANNIGGLLERIDKYPDHLRAIGLIVTEWSRLEGTLCLTMWHLLKDAVLGNTVFHTLGSSKARADVIRALALELLSGELQKETVAVTDKLRDLAEQRNAIAHGEWGTPARGGPDPFVSTLRPATKNPIFQKIYSVAELNDLATRIGALETRVDMLNTALRYHLNSDDRAAEIDQLRARFPGLDASLKRFE